MRKATTSTGVIPVLALALAWAGAAALAAPPGAAPGRDHDVTIGDYFTQGYVSAIETAPAGDFVAYVEARWDEGLDRRNMDVWVVDTATRGLRRLTFDPAADTRPRWSADGGWVYFLSSRERAGEERPPLDGSTQVWRVRAGGGEPQPVTRVTDGVQSYAISADGRALYYVAGKKHVDADAWKSLRERFPDVEYGHGVVTFGVLWTLDLETWRSRKLVDEDRVIGAFAVSADGRRVAMITTPTEELITNEGWSHVDVYDADLDRVVRLEDRPWRDEAPSPYGWIVSPTFSSDGRKLAFRVDFDGYPGTVFACHLPPPGGGYDDVAISRVARPGEVSVEGTMAWTPRTHDLGFLAEDHARRRLIRVTAITESGHGPAVTMTPGDVVLDGFSFASIETSSPPLAVLRSGLDHGPDIFLARAVGAGTERFERITNLNPQVDTWKLPQIKIVKWRSDDGTEVEGILQLPADYGLDPACEEGPLPLLVAIHGGPTASSKYAFRFGLAGHTLFPARGWAVFDPNYRGSTGYGDRFLIDLVENKNNLDVRDILAGVDMLVAEGIADPDRLAVSGWSNGGYLTNCLIAATDRFKAASSGAGVFDVVMQWSIEDTPGHVINYAGGLPWERGEKMHQTSPLYAVDRVVTPTLVHVGENDERVPAAHGRALHRALHHYLDVPCELVVYPGAGHGLSKYSHRKAKLTWDVEWFDHFVRGESAESERPRPGPGSPADSGP